MNDFQREEQVKNAEVFRKKRDSIRKEQEQKTQMRELLGKRRESKASVTKKDDELSVSSGDGEVFVHNLMGFWT